MLETPSPFTREQLNEIQRLIASSSEDLLKTVKTSVAEALTTNGQTILKTINDNITETLKSQQNIVVETKIEKGKDKSESVGWKLAIAAIPVILTAFLGFMVWRAQSSIEKQISDSNETLKIELALKEEFYKKKISIYAATDELMFQFLDDLQASTLDFEKKGEARKDLQALYKALTRQNLYMSDEVANEIQELFDLGSDAGMLNPDGKITTNQISQQILNVEAKMKEELNIKTMSRLLPTPTPTSANEANFKR